MRRRVFLGALAASSLARGQVVPSQQAPRFQPAQDIGPLVRQLADGIAPQEGGIEVELPQIAENGNSVPLTVNVASPMSAQDRVVALHVIAERNPRPLVASFRFGPAAGKAQVSTRVRLAGTQKVTLLAILSERRVLMKQVDVLVTAAACLDESL